MCEMFSCIVGLAVRRIYAFFHVAVKIKKAVISNLAILLKPVSKRLNFPADLDACRCKVYLLKITCQVKIKEAAIDLRLQRLDQAKPSRIIHIIVKYQEVIEPFSFGISHYYHPFCIHHHRSEQEVQPYHHRILLQTLHSHVWEYQSYTGTYTDN